MPKARGFILLQPRSAKHVLTCHTRTCWIHSASCSYGGPLSVLSLACSCIYHANRKLANDFIDSGYYFWPNHIRGDAVCFILQPIRTRLICGYHLIFGLTTELKRWLPDLFIERCCVSPSVFKVIYMVLLCLYECLLPCQSHT